ncbi:MAG: relaxase/mobilization nuclease domain-containing protein [Butyricicoccus sp.]|nr:relaxase/mobilization nuclease domain-containing protein [Butyricicoccus sp.]
MAILKTANGKGRYFNEDAKEVLTEYIFRADKAIHGYFGGVGVDLINPAGSMTLVSERFGKTDGVQLRHFIISFEAWELNDPAVANEIAQHTAKYIGQEYQALYSVHEDKPNLHFHLVHNSVSYRTGARYYGRKSEFYAFQSALRGILRHYGINKLQYVSSKDY